VAIELYRNPDDSVGGLDAGKVMVAPTQEAFEDCCCEDFGECCGPSPGGYVQDDAIVSIDGECGNLGEEQTEECAACCQGAGGTYESVGCGLSAGPPEDIFVWLWRKGLWDLQAVYGVDSHVWQYRLDKNFDAGDPECTGFGMFFNDNGAPLNCNRTTHKLSGSFSLPGVEKVAIYCACGGCTANVTIGLI